MHNLITPNFDIFVENYLNGYDRDAAYKLKELGQIKDINIFSKEVQLLEHSDIDLLKRIVNLTEMSLKGYGSPKWLNHFYKCANRFYNNTSF